MKDSRRIITPNQNKLYFETIIYLLKMSSSNSELAQKYQRKTDKQHVLDNPGMYIGSTEQTDAHLWVFSSSTSPSKQSEEVEGSKIISKKITYIPALYKLFDEIIVNARDHVVRMIHLDSPDKKLVTSIEVVIDAATGAISVTNDGNGVDVDNIR